MKISKKNEREFIKSLKEVGIYLLKIRKKFLKKGKWSKGQYFNRSDKIVDKLLKKKLKKIIDIKIQSEENWQDGEMHDSVESFGIGKRVLVILSKNYDKQYNIKTLNLILPNAFGPGDHLDPERSHALNAIIVRMIKSKNDGDNSFEVWGSGKPKREWIYVEDVVRVMKLLLNKKIKNNLILNIGQNKAFSINEIAFTIKKILKYKCKIKNNKKYPDGAPLKQLSNFKFKKYFKNFKFTNFESAVNNTIKAYLKKN